MVVVGSDLAYTTATTSLLGEVMSVVRILLPELLAPLAYGFVGDDDPTCKQQLFTIAIAEADTGVQPGRAAMLLGRVGWHYRFHAASMSQRAEPV
jgi:hypothetical protein